MNLNQIKEFLDKESIHYESNVNLKKKTWIHRGGMASFFVIPQDLNSLERVMTFIYANSIDFLLIGCTSNLYILNTTNIPVVISTLRCNGFVVNDSYIICECGVQVSKLARHMIEDGISGFEYLTKLPGTIGAAICNNSSVESPKNSITELLENVKVITPEGVKCLTKDDLHLDFRTSDIKRHILQGIILSARLRKNQGNREELSRISLISEEKRNRILEGSAQNLGCTVNRMFCNGQMPSRFKFPLRIYGKLVSMMFKDELKQKKLKKRFLLTISGHRRLIPYISDKQLIIFIWKDENADAFFDEYLQFMRDVCKTDKVEIEIIR